MWCLQQKNTKTFNTIKLKIMNIEKKYKEVQNGKYFLVSLSECQSDSSIQGFEIWQFFHQGFLQLLAWSLRTCYSMTKSKTRKTITTCSTWGTDIAKPKIQRFGSISKTWTGRRYEYDVAVMQYAWFSNLFWSKRNGGIYVLTCFVDRGGLCG